MLLQARHRAMLDDLLGRFLPPTAEVWAYGSRVTGEAHEASDLDLVVRRPNLEALRLGKAQLPAPLAYRQQPAHSGGHSRLGHATGELSRPHPGPLRGATPGAGRGPSEQLK